MTVLTRVAGLLTALLLAAAAFADEAADAAPRHFAIAPQALDAAVFAFSHQSGLQVFFPSELGTGLQSPGVEGEMPPLRT